MQPCRIIYYSLAALHVSSDIFAHHQEHLNCIIASGITHVWRCRLVSWYQQLCRIIYYSLAALHVSSDIFAHHQEHLNCITASGITHVCHCQLVSWECWNQFQHSHDTSRQQHMCVIPEAVIQFRYFCVFFFVFVLFFVCLFVLFVCLFFAVALRPHAGHGLLIFGVF